MRSKYLLGYRFAIVLLFVFFSSCTLPAGGIPSPTPTGAPTFRMATPGLSAAPVPAATLSIRLTEKPLPTSAPNTPTHRPSATPRPIAVPTPTPAPAAPLPVQFELVGQYGGTPGAVAVQEGYAYLAVGPRLLVVDLADPVAPKVVGQSEVLPGLIDEVAVDGTAAYVMVSRDDYSVAGAESRLAVVDIADAAAPHLLGISEPIAGVAHDLAVAGGRAYLGEGDIYRPGSDPLSGVRVLDVSDPARPSEVGFMSTSVAVLPLAASEGYLYVGTVGQGLLVLEYSEAEGLQQVGTLADISGTVQELLVRGHYAYIGADALLVVDLSDPTNPRQVGSYLSPEEWQSISYLALGDDEARLVVGYEGCGEMCSTFLRVLDVSDPALPVLKSSFDEPLTAAGLAAGGAYFYLSDPLPGKEGGLAVVAMDDRAGLNRAGSLALPGGIVDVVVRDNTAYLLSRSGLQVLNVADPANPASVGRYASPLLFGHLLAPDDLLYLTSYAGLESIDLSDPTRPRPVGRFDLFWELWEAGDVAAAGGYLYVWPSMQRLEAVSTTDPAKLMEAGRIDPLSDDRNQYPVGMTAGSSVIYVIMQNGRLLIVDGQDPSNLSVLSTLRLGLTGDTGGLAVVDGRLYVALQGLCIVDVQDPLHPRQLSCQGAAWRAGDVEVAGNYIYLYTGGNGLQLFDVSDPAAPIQVGFFDTLEQRNIEPHGNIFVSGGLVYIAAVDAGLLIVRR